jgi:hypothetical protein
MIHPIADQLRFTRSEFRRGLAGLSKDDAKRRFLPMNCIAWNVGHLAWQEQRCFLTGVLNKTLFPELNTLFAYGAPASAPDLEEMWTAWKAVTQAVDPWLDMLNRKSLQKKILLSGSDSIHTHGSLLQRVIYHYWYHTGENMAIRQMLGQTDLPQFVGNIDREAPYRPEI